MRSPDTRCRSSFRRARRWRRTRAPRRPCAPAARRRGGRRAARRSCPATGSRWIRRRKRAGCPLPRAFRGRPASGRRRASEPRPTTRARTFPLPCVPFGRRDGEAGLPRTCVSGTRAPWRRCSPASRGWRGSPRSRRPDRPRPSRRGCRRRGSRADRRSRRAARPRCRGSSPRETQDPVDGIHRDGMVTRPGLAVDGQAALAPAGALRELLVERLDVLATADRDEEGPRGGRRRGRIRSGSPSAATGRRLRCCRSTSGRRRHRARSSSPTAAAREGGAGTPAAPASSSGRTARPRPGLSRRPSRRRPARPPPGASRPGAAPRRAGPGPRSTSAAGRGRPARSPSRRGARSGSRRSRRS